MKQKNDNDHKRSSKGFTIVELLIVIVIIAILATIGFVSYNRIIDKGQVGATKSIVQQYTKVLGAYYADHGKYPTRDDLDAAEMAAATSNGGNSDAACLGTGYRASCGPNIAPVSEIASFHALLSEYVGENPPNVSPHDIPLTVDPTGSGQSLTLTGVAYAWNIAFEGNSSGINGENVDYSMIYYALDEADAQCTGGQVLTLTDTGGMFNTSDTARNTLTDDENTACVMLLPE